MPVVSVFMPVVDESMPVVPCSSTISEKGCMDERKERQDVVVRCHQWRYLEWRGRN